MKKVFATLAAIGIIFANSSAVVQAASDTANAIQTVIAAIAIAQVSDLDFGTAPQGDAAKTVAPGTAEDAENASFAVTGEPSTSYTITLPADSTVVMTTGAGGANETIAVDSFTSFPVTTGTLDGSGAQSLFVGATRAALGASQVAGSYTGAFTVTVVY